MRNLRYQIPSWSWANDATSLDIRQFLLLFSSSLLYFFSFANFFFFFHIFLFFNFLFFFLPPSLLSLLSPSLLSVQLYRLQQGHTRFYPLSLEKVALWQGLDTLRRGLLFFFFFYLYITYILSWQPDAPRRWAKITN